MKIRLSKIEDIPKIMEIIEDAKQYLATQKIDQWQKGYPHTEQVENDIKKEESYVVINDENKIIATAMFTLRKEPSYKVIEGNWLIDEAKTYGVIHRMSIKKEFKKLGLATLLFNKFHQELKTKNIQSLKIDTHEDNLGMQALIKKMGYTYCGIIYTRGNKRLAFEKILIS